MAYDNKKLFMCVSTLMSEAPMLSLRRISQVVKCSHPTIEKAVFINTSLSFRDYRKKMLFEKVIRCTKEGCSEKAISFEVGYTQPEHLSRFIKSYTGLTFMQLKQNLNTFIIQIK
jgi:AraC-like DNA-binding protein